MKKLRHILVAIIGICSLATLNAQEVKTKDYNLEKGVAIQGYDPVAYFTENNAIEGKSTISSKYNGAGSI